MDTSILTQILTVLQQNPIFLGLIIAVIRNLGGYITECFNAHAIVQYQGAKLLETLTLYETFFIAAGQIGGLPNVWTIALAVGVDIVRSLKKGILGAAETQAGVTTYGAWIEQKTIMASEYGVAGTTVYQRPVYIDNNYDHTEITTTKPT